MNSKKHMFNTPFLVFFPSRVVHLHVADYDDLCAMLPYRESFAFEGAIVVDGNGGCFYCEHVEHSTFVTPFWTRIPLLDICLSKLSFKFSIGGIKRLKLKWTSIKVTEEQLNILLKLHIKRANFISQCFKKKVEASRLSLMNRIFLGHWGTSSALKFELTCFSSFDVKKGMAGRLIAAVNNNGLGTVIDSVKAVAKNYRNDFVVIGSKPFSSECVV